MHMLLVILTGILLLGVFVMFGKLWGGDAAGIASGARHFVPVWVAVALVTMWGGVTKAGYTAMQELPVLGVVIAVPAAVARLPAWQIARS